MATYFDAGSITVAFLFVIASFFISAYTIWMHLKNYTIPNMQVGKVKKLPL